jgi:hypothetical protein
MRKLTAFVLIFMLMLSTVAVGYAAPKGTPPGQAKKMVRFDDVADDHWAAETIYQLAASGKLKGYGNGKFMPNKPVTKLESLVMLYEAASGESKDTKIEDYGLYKGPDWGKDYYAWAGRNGAFGDSAKLFNANAAITRAEFAFYAANLNVDDKNFDWEAYEGYTNRYDDDDDIDDELEGHIGFMNHFRLMKGDDMNMFHGGGALKRSEAATVMRRLIFFDYGEVSDPWASIDVEEEDGCITSLNPEIEIRFSELVFDDDEKEFTTSNAEDVISFEDESDGVEFTVTDIDRTATKEIWTLEPDEELSEEEEYTIWLDDEDIFDKDGNELRDDAEETFATCETYSMTADYEAEFEFYADDSEDWLDFTIDVDANDEDGTDVKLVFDLPGGVSIQYQDGSNWEDLTNEDVYDENGFELSDGIVDYFRARFASSGAYDIPVEFTTADSEEDVLFTLEMEMGRVDLDRDSRGEAGNGVIYGLDDETPYRVTEIDGKEETVYYTNEDGELEEDFEDMEALDDGVTMITGLNNDFEYMVEIPLSLEIDEVTESALEDWDFEFEITSTANDDEGKDVEAYYLFDEDMTLEYYDDDSDDWIEIFNNGQLGPWTFKVGDTDEFRIDLNDADDKILTVEFWTADEELMLGRVEYEFEIE